MSEPEKLLALALIGIVMLFIYLIGELFLRSRKQKEQQTPVTKEGLVQYDELPSGVAVLMAWTEAGEHQSYHSLMQEEVRKNMPVLARALDRMANE